MDTYNRFLFCAGIILIIYTDSISCEINPNQPTGSLLEALNPENQQPVENSGLASILFPDNYPKHGISVQSGYDGYLVPTTPEESTYDKAVELLGTLTKKGALIYFVKSVVPKIGSVILKGGAVALALSILFITGFLLTSIICTYTSVCSIHFANLNEDLAEESVRTFLSKDKIDSLAVFVKNSIKKFKKQFKHKFPKNL